MAPKSKLYSQLKQQKVVLKLIVISEGTAEICDFWGKPEGKVMYFLIPIIPCYPPHPCHSATPTSFVKNILGSSRIYGEVCTSPPLHTTNAKNLALQKGQSLWSSSFQWPQNCFNPNLTAKLLLTQNLPWPGLDKRRLLPRAKGVQQGPNYT